MYTCLVMSQATSSQSNWPASQMLLMLFFDILIYKLDQNHMKVTQTVHKDMESESNEGEEKSEDVKEAFL